MVGVVCGRSSAERGGDLAVAGNDGASKGRRRVDGALVAKSGRSFAGKERHMANDDEMWQRHTLERRSTHSVALLHREMLAGKQTEAQSVSGCWLDGHSAGVSQADA